MTDRHPLGSGRSALAVLILAQLGVIACGSGTVQPGSSIPRPEASPIASTPARSSTIAVPSSTSHATQAPRGPYDGVRVTPIAADILDLGDTEVGYLAASADDIWVATSTGVVRVDPTTFKASWVDHEGRFGLAASANAVWTTNFEEGTVSASTRLRRDGRRPWT